MPAQTRKSAASAGAGSLDKPKAAPKTKRPAPDPTHRVLREIVIGGEPRAVGELVHLDGLDAAELENLGYVVKATDQD